VRRVTQRLQRRARAITLGLVSDADRRLLERTAQAGDLQAEARLLLARVRDGELAEERLRLAALLGDPAAREACAPLDLAEPSLHAWCAAIAAHGEAAFARAAGAIAHAAARRLPEVDRADGVQDALAALDDAAAGRLDPAAGVARFGAAAVALAGRWEPGLDMGKAARERRLEFVVFSACVTLQLRQWPPEALELGFERGVPDRSLDRVLTSAHSVLTEPELRAAVAAELLPWALGRGDPVCERVDAAMGA
jgi:hypothetical protein